MARVNQFAKDLGINYNQAKNLINKGRSRKDGGSQILENTMSVTKKKFGGATLTSKDAKKIKKNNKKPKDPMGDRFGKDGDLKFRETAKKPYHPKHNPDQYHPTLNPDGKKGRPKVEKKKDGGLGMQSVKYGLDDNPAITAADPKAKFIAANKKAGGGMPKMPEYRDGGAPRKKMQASGARRTAKARKDEPKEILTPFKGVLKTSEGETLRNIDGKTFLVKPNPKFKKRMRRMRDGGAFRGCGAQVKGKKFKGIF